MAKLTALFLILSLLAVFAYAQADQADQDDAADAQQFGDAAGADQADPTQFYDPEYIQQQQEAQRSKLWGCYFLAKNRLFSRAEDLGKLMAGNKGEALFKRMAVDIMKRCLDRIDVPLSQKILQGLTEETMNTPEFEQLHGFNIEDYKKEDVNLELEGDEKFIYEYYSKIDESVRNHWEEQADKEESNKRRQRLDYEPHIGGLSLKETSPFVKTLYTAGVLGVISILFFIAYKMLFANNETPYEKLKRERAEKKKGKAQ